MRLTLKVVSMTFTEMISGCKAYCVMSLSNESEALTRLDDGFWRITSRLLCGGLNEAVSDCAWRFQEYCFGQHDRLHDFFYYSVVLSVGTFFFFFLIINHANLHDLKKKSKVKHSCGLFPSVSLTLEALRIGGEDGGGRRRRAVPPSDGFQSNQLNVEVVDIAELEATRPQH